MQGASCRNQPFLCVFFPHTGNYQDHVIPTMFYLRSQIVSKKCNLHPFQAEIAKTPDGVRANALSLAAKVKILT